MDPAWKLEYPTAAPQLQTVESLFWYEGPRIVAIKVDGDMHVGTWSDCDDDVDRWIFSPAPDAVIGSLKAGILPLRDAFTREPTALVVDTRKTDGTVVNAWKVAVEDLPQKALAEEGVKLKPKS